MACGKKHVTVWTRLVRLQYIRVETDTIFPYAVDIQLFVDSLGGTMATVMSSCLTLTVTCRLIPLLAAWGGSIQLPADKVRGGGRGSSTAKASQDKHVQSSRQYGPRTGTS